MQMSRILLSGCSAPSRSPASIACMFASVSSKSFLAFMNSVMAAWKSGSGEPCAR